MFGSTKLNEKGKKELEIFKTTMSESVSYVAELMPEGRLKSLFMTKVEDAVFRGTEAICNNPENFLERIDYPERSSSVN